MFINIEIYARVETERKEGPGSREEEITEKERRRRGEGRRSTDRCVALVSSGHMRLRRGDSPPETRRQPSPIRCHRGPLATVSLPPPHSLDRVSHALPARRCRAPTVASSSSRPPPLSPRRVNQPPLFPCRRACDRFRRVAALRRGWGSTNFSNFVGQEEKPCVLFSRKNLSLKI